MFFYQHRVLIYCGLISPNFLNLPAVHNCSSFSFTFLSFLFYKIMIPIRFGSTTPLTSGEETPDLVSSSWCSSQSEQNYLDKDDSPIQELARRELASRRDGAVSSSSPIFSRLEIVVHELMDEDILELSSQLVPSDLVVGEGLALQPVLDNLFGVLPSKSDVR